MIRLLASIPPRDQIPMFVVGLGHGATHWVAAFFYLLLPYITTELELSYASAGLLVGLLHAASAATNLFSGALVDMTGKRVVYQMMSLVMGALALLAFGFTEAFVLLGAVAVVIGASNNLWHPPAIALLSERFPANRGYALAIHALGASLGDTLAPLACGGLLVVLSWQATAMTGSMLVFAVAAFVGVMLLAQDRGTATTRSHTGGLSGYLRGLRDIARDRGVLGLCLMAGFRSITQNGLYMFLPLFLVHEVGAGPMLMGIAMMLLQAGGIVAAPLAGAWSDRVGRRKVVLAGLTGTTLVLLLLTAVRHEVVFVSGIAVMGFLLFAVRPVVHSWMMDITPKQMAGSATSLMFATQALLSSLVPPVGGLVADRYGLPSVFYLLAGSMVIANMLVYLLPGEKPLEAAA